MSVVQTFECPCGAWSLTHDGAAVQAVIDDELDLVNGLLDTPVAPIPAASVVDGLLLHHLSTCVPAQEALARHRRDWRKAVTWQPLPRLTDKNRTTTRRRSA